MKYCPYCGASLLGGAASFCPECGKAVQQEENQAAESKRPPAASRRKPVDDSYDGYYNDVQPIDADEVRKKSDPEMVKRIVCVVAGAVILICMAIILMTVL